MDSEELAKQPLKGETEAIIGAAFEVLNNLGHGLLEKPYENALCVEFGIRGIPFQQQPRFLVGSKKSQIIHPLPDEVANRCVDVDTSMV